MVSAKPQFSIKNIQYEYLFSPLPNRSDATTNESSSDLSSEEDGDYEALHRAAMIEKSLLSPAPDQALGEWEKHTKGFGSRILQKLGYIPGTGLGQNGEGIVIPISAQILPPGRSLDHCMELREQANGDKNLFSVEHRMKKLKKKQEAANEKAYARESQKTDVFSFINDSIFTKASHSKATAAAPVERKDFKNQTNVNLNVEKFKLGEDIRRKEREIEHVQLALQRHKSDTPMYKQLNGQLQAKRSELSVMRKSESNMAREQNYRKDKTKMSVFWVPFAKLWNKYKGISYLNILVWRIIYLFSFIALYSIFIDIYESSWT